MKKILTILTASVVLAVFASAAFAAVTFDPATGTGFVGKGDVQLVYNWSNKALQDNAGSVQFQAVSEEVTEVSWVCTNVNNSNVPAQERERTTTTSIEGVVASVGRVRNQITGFNLSGYSGTTTNSGPVTEGPGLNTCPNNWVLTTPAGDPEVVSSTSALMVSIDGTDWRSIG